MTSKDHYEDGELTAKQQAAVDTISSAVLAEIDQELLKSITGDWQKVAKVVGLTASSLGGRGVDIPDIYYAQRLIGFRDDGLIESRGNMRSMRFSEIRIAIRKSPKLWNPFKVEAMLMLLIPALVVIVAMLGAVLVPYFLDR